MYMTERGQLNPEAIQNEKPNGEKPQTEQSEKKYHCWIKKVPLLDKQGQKDIHFLLKTKLKTKENLHQSKFRSVSSVTSREGTVGNKPLSNIENSKQYF